MSEIVYIGIKGSVLAFHRQTGDRLWEQELEGSGFVNLFVDGDLLIATTHGEVFCLEAATGKLLWKDELAGYGYGMASIATAGGAANPAASQAAQQQQQQTAASVAIIAATS